MTSCVTMSCYLSPVVVQLELGKTQKIVSSIELLANALSIVVFLAPAMTAEVVSPNGH